MKTIDDLKKKLENIQKHFSEATRIIEKEIAELRAVTAEQYYPTNDFYQCTSSWNPSGTVKIEKDVMIEEKKVQAAIDDLRGLFSIANKDEKELAAIALIQRYIAELEAERPNLLAARRMVQKLADCEEQGKGECEADAKTCIMACKKQLKLEAQIKEKDEVIFKSSYGDIRIWK